MAIDRMTGAGMMGRSSVSLAGTGRKSAARTAANDMKTRSR
jgi:hypothetical protein